MDPSTQFSLDVSEAARMRRAAAALISEGAQRMAEAEAKERDARRGGYSLVRALRASGECNWTIAPIERGESDRLAALYGRPARATNGFFIEEGLATRAMTAASGAGGGYLVASAAPLAIEAARPANDFLSLCTIVRPQNGAGNLLVGKMSSAPAVTVLTDESTQAGDETPEATQAILTPKNHATYIEESRDIVLQTGEAGARAIASLIVNALRTHAQVQILTGSGANGEVLGLCNDSTIPTASGGTLTYSTVCAACEDVEGGAGDAELVWVVTAPAASVMRQRPITGTDGPPILGSDGKVAGYRVIVVGGTTDSVAVLGAWRDLLIAEFLPIEVAVNPFAVFRAAVIGVRGWLSFDATAKVAGRFATITAIT